VLKLLVFYISISELKNVAFNLNKHELIPLFKESIKVGLKLTMSHSGEEDFKQFFSVFLLFCSDLPLKIGAALHQRMVCAKFGRILEKEIF
jgi:hypothetical protein